MEKRKYKSSLVVCPENEIPVIETFFGESVSDITRLMEEWMERNQYDSGRAHVYEWNDENNDWVTINKGDIVRGETLPLYAVVLPGTQDMQRCCSFMKDLYIHLPSGRLIQMTNELDGPVPGYFEIHFCFNAPDGQLRFVATIKTLTVTEMEMYAQGKSDEVFKKIADDIGPTFGHWFIKHITGLNNNILKK